MAGLLLCSLAPVFTACVDNDDDVPENLLMILLGNQQGGITVTKETEIMNERIIVYFAPVAFDKSTH